MTILSHNVLPHHRLMFQTCHNYYTINKCLGNPSRALRETLVEALILCSLERLMNYVQDVYCIVLQTSSMPII